MWSSYNEFYIILFVFATLHLLAIAMAVFSIALLILLNSVSIMVLIVLFLLNIWMLRSIVLPIEVDCYGRWKFRFWHILDYERELMCLKVSLDQVFLLLVSTSSSLWQTALCIVMVEVDLCWIFRGCLIILIFKIRISIWDMRQDIDLLAIPPLCIHYMIAESIIFHLRDVGRWWNFVFI